MTTFQNSIKYLCFLCLPLLVLPVNAHVECEDYEDYYDYEIDYNYMKIGDDRTGSVSMLYLPSVEKRTYYSGEYVAGWVKYVYSDDGAKEFSVPGGLTPFYSMDFYAANRELKQVQILSSAVYDKYGRVIYTNNKPFSSYFWEECIPNTNGEAVWFALMKAAGYTKF